MTVCTSVLASPCRSEPARAEEPCAQGSCSGPSAALFGRLERRRLPAPPRDPVLVEFSACLDLNDRLLHPRGANKLRKCSLVQSTRSGDFDWRAQFHKFRRLWDYTVAFSEMRAGCERGVTQSEIIPPRSIRQWGDSFLASAGEQLQVFTSTPRVCTPSASSGRVGAGMLLFQARRSPTT